MDADDINQQLMEIEQEINEEIERVAAVQAEAAAQGIARVGAAVPRRGRYRAHRPGRGREREREHNRERGGANDNMNEDEGGDAEMIMGDNGAGGHGNDHGNDDDVINLNDDNDDANDDNNNNNNNINNNGNNGGDRNANPNANDAIELDDDDDDDEVEEEEDEEALGGFHEQDVVDGGVATGKGSNEPATMYLLIECQEQLYNADHPILQPNVTVSIGLDKTTRLSSVFRRYVEFCSEQNPTKGDTTMLDIADLEFVHCSVLQASDTAEAAALMKNDKIKVQRPREKERRANADWIKTQRDSDRDYFNQMRSLADLNPSPCDVVFHCQGRIKDDKGLMQEVLRPYVRGHSAILSKRCKWLSNQIMVAKGEFGDKQANDGQNEHGRVENNENDHVVERERDDDDTHREDDGDDGIVLQPGHDHNRNVNIHGRGGDNNNGANAVEVDDDDDERNRVHNIQDVSADEASPMQPSASRAVARNVSSSDRDSPYLGGNLPDTLCVTLSHPPEAVKILLEYCYTNRVVSLGQKAFQKSYHATDVHTLDEMLIPHSGPISPYPSGLRSLWPNNGKPLVSLSVALAGIRLAEEANLTRLSFMCETAAAQLVTTTTALEALSLCEQQYKETGNRLRQLRKVVMYYHILGRGSMRGGLDDTYRLQPSFKRTLQEKKDVVVPSLLKGVLEAFNDAVGEKRKPSDHGYCQSVLLNRRKNTDLEFKLFDKQDSNSRSQERLKWRKERWGKRPRWNDREKNPYGLEDDLDFESGHSRPVGANYMSVLETTPYIMDGGNYAHLPSDLTRHHGKSSRSRMGRKNKFSASGSSRTSKSRKRR